MHIAYQPELCHIRHTHPPRGVHPPVGSRGSHISFSPRHLKRLVLWVMTSMCLLGGIPAQAGILTTNGTVDFTKGDVDTKTPPAGVSSYLHTSIEFYNQVAGGTVQINLVDDKGNIILTSPPQVVPIVGWYGLGMWGGNQQPTPKNGFSIQVILGNGAKIDLAGTKTGFHTGTSASLVDYDKISAVDSKTPVKPAPGPGL